MNDYDNMLNNNHDNNIIDNNDNNIFEVDTFDFKKIDIIVNRTNIIFDKIDIIIEDWFKYQLFNKSTDIINNVDNLLLELNYLTNDARNTINIYNDIGNILLNKISLFLYVMFSSFIILIITQIIICTLLSFMYKNNSFRVKINDIKENKENKDNQQITNYKYYI
tara:strand:- start:225 stop:719 length:495 start_codon:yes stop_codon:yes gene_type:complete